mgnify:CR=1 FL=1
MNSLQKSMSARSNLLVLIQVVQADQLDQFRIEQATMDSWQVRHRGPWRFQEKLDTNRESEYDPSSPLRF